ncbi:hypothetical protein L195_g027458, partial [Trifolium pratense]
MQTGIKFFHQFINLWNGFYNEELQDVGQDELAEEPLHVGKPPILTLINNEDIIDQS